MKHSIHSDTADMMYTEHGRQIEIFARLANEKKGLYKAWIAGANGKLEIGTFMPEGDALQLRRNISVDRLQTAGCFPITKGGATLVHSFQSKHAAYGWTMKKNPEDLFLNDHLLKKSATGLQGCLIRRTTSGFQLAVPYHSRQPFPMMPIICFSKVGYMQGKGYAIFSFDENACPIV